MSQEFAHATLEDRIFSLELALSTIGGALLAPGSWEDDQRLHQYMYDTVRRALQRTPFGDALDQREQQLFVREAPAVVVESADQTEPPPAPAVTPDPPALAGEEPVLASEGTVNSPREYGWPAQP
jgi:hypothetical protein